MHRKVVRSTLILPVNIPRFVEKASSSGADCIMLDLEDSVPRSEKENARKRVRDSISIVAQGGGYVLVRINNDPELLFPDLEASIYSGIDGIALPKTESAADVEDLESKVERLERERGITPGHIRFSLVIETPRGLLNIQKIAAASPRIEAMSIGPEDYTLELGVEPSSEGTELFFPVSVLVTVCKAWGVSPIGLVGSIAGFKDLEGFERAAIRARQLGCEGARCIHPAQVVVLNRVFSQSPDKIEHARRVVRAFEEGIKEGKASVQIDGKMVDTPVYNRAKRTVEHADAIDQLERRKSETLAHTR